MNKKVLLAAGVLFLTAGTKDLSAAKPQENINKMEKLTLTKEWDKTFPKSDKVHHSKVTFVNRYGITLAADMYKPKGAAGKLPAIAVCGPFGAVKEQAAGLYAQEMAERGFLTIAFDPSFTGESGGAPRYMTSPDINTEDFSAAVDYLVTNPDVHPKRVGIIGICGWGGIAVNAAAADPRIKATLASTMYDMSRVNANGYFDTADSAEARNELREKLAAQRTEDYRNGTPKPGGGVPDADEPCLGNRECRDDTARREGPLLLLRQRRLQEADRNSRQGEQQTVRGGIGSKPHRPLRPKGHNPLRRNREILRRVSPQVTLALRK